MNDNDIIKALECCTSSTTSEACNGCPLFDTTICTEMGNGLQIYALDLINRQKAEIERLCNKLNVSIQNVENMARAMPNIAKATRDEAIKEFAKRLKLFAITKFDWNQCVDIEDIDKLVKEMTEGRG